MRFVAKLVLSHSERDGRAQDPAGAGRGALRSVRRASASHWERVAWLRSSPRADPRVL